MRWEPGDAHSAGNGYGEGRGAVQNGLLVCDRLIRSALGTWLREQGATSPAARQAVGGTSGGKCELGWEWSPAPGVCLLLGLACLLSDCSLPACKHATGICHALVRPWALPVGDQSPQYRGPLCLPLTPGSEDPLSESHVQRNKNLPQLSQLG